MNTIFRIVLSIVWFLEEIGIGLSNPVPVQPEEVEVDHNNNEYSVPRPVSWDWLGLGQMSRENFILTCSLISGSIFLIVAIFAVLIFFVEAQEFKVLGRKTANDCRSHCYGIEMERRLNGSESGKFGKCHQNQKCGLIAQDTVDSRCSGKVTDRLLAIPCSRRCSLDEVSFKTIPEEDERQMEDFYSIN